MITIVGLGFVGLSTAFKFSYIDNKKVYGYDIDNEKLKLLNNGTMYLLEPEFTNILDKTLNKTFFPVNSLEEAIKNSKYIFICVNTSANEDGSVDLSQVLDSVKNVLINIKDKKYRTIIIKSTVPPTTTKEVLIPYIETFGFKVGKDIGICNNPEFLREGHCYEDINNLDRIVIGIEDEKTRSLVNDLYSQDKSLIYNVNLNTGEFIKYLSNSMLANMISFSNEMALLADTIGDINITSSFRIIQKDKRWSNCNMKTYFYPGCGYGGYCLPKDTRALLDIANKFDYQANILRAGIELNDLMPLKITKRIERKCQKKTKIGILGLSFKPLSSGVRNTVTKVIIENLINDGYNNINAYDPVSINNFKKEYKFKINYLNSLTEIINESDILVILTAWEEFRDISKLTDKVIIDCRYML